jgi:hypothetical protein
MPAGEKRIENRSEGERLMALEIGQEQIHESVTQIKHAIFGNGSEGLKVKVDRLEQAGIGHSKIVVLVCTVLAAIISAAGGVIAAAIK